MKWVRGGSGEVGEGRGVEMGMRGGEEGRGEWKWERGGEWKWG